MLSANFIICSVKMNIYIVSKNQRILTLKRKQIRCGRYCTLA